MLLVSLQRIRSLNFKRNLEFPYRRLFSSSQIQIDEKAIVRNELSDEELITIWRENRSKWNKLVSTLATESSFINQVNRKLIDMNSWFDYVNLFRRTAIKNPLMIFNPGQLKFLVDTVPLAVKELHSAKRTKTQYVACSNYVFDILFQNAVRDLSDTIAMNRILSLSTDLRLPHEWYPYTRLMKRKIIYHGGPTNSGKV